MEEKITFAILYQSENRTERIRLPEYDTVAILKEFIHNNFDVPPHKQIIVGWTNPPESEQTILQWCCQKSHINHLTIVHSDMMEVDNFLSKQDETDLLEIESSQACFKQICTSITTHRILFNIVSLKDAVEQALLVPVEKRKALLLYMHNSKNEFANQFLNFIRNENILKLLLESFFFVGWDVENRKYHESLCKALTDIDLTYLCNFVETKMCTAIIIQNIHGQIKTQAVLVEGTENNDIQQHLNNSQAYLKTDRLQAIEASKVQNNQDPSDLKTEMNSKAFQKLMADQLGDRDYDCYEFNQHDYLKKNIGFALFGPPQSEDGYVEKETKNIEKIYEVVIKHNNKFCEYKDQVELASIFNCTQPLPSDKQSRQKKNPNYNPNTDIIPVPIFVLRKCRESDNPCRIFIDDIGRKYDRWSEYIERNKLDKCEMVLPKDGRYKVENDEVLLETHNSPACSVLRTIFNVGDIASTVGSLGSGGIMLAASATTITTVAVAPAALITAGVVGAGAGVYALGRSIGHLVDRVKHDESLSFANSEARGIYFNLLAGSLGFVGAGANMAVSQLAANGVNIGKGVGVAVNSIGVANIGVSGASIVNSGYDVFDQWYNQNQTPSLLTIVQLSSSILFFGSAVYSFKTCQTIIDESQARVLQDYSESLRSNRHRKTFNKMMKETIRQNDGNQVKGRAEVIKTIRNIPNKDEVFGVLTRTNKDMNKKGVKFYASGGEITLDGQSINMNEFIVMNKQEASAFLSNLPLKTDISSIETANFIDQVKDFSVNWELRNLQHFAEYALRLIGTFGSNIQGMLLQILNDVIPFVIDTFKTSLEEIFPDNSMVIKLLCMLMEYFGGKSSEYMRSYQKWRETGSHYYYNEDFEDVPVNKTERYIWVFVKLIKICFNSGHIEEHDLKDIIKFAERFVINEIYEYERKQEADKTRKNHSPERPQKTKCKICSGFYFTK